ncbi:Pentapeptide repeat [Acididesulfobacillus acetoxydans]|uniref:Pentapeptide repeat n=1 Tax=Acididesulfobacillus acetoxydans TaxID=1561005 RepID=A0A8S0WKW9_9FIRM|nr:pentapeptide repeat-containing protein [Acididesulfobacillus acetoxydans]CAA7599674.1 Pentapeptide repeat [Acididesulfobacillus acetoxydans]CEJ06226.1 Pentapeptide repeat protein [Acididesulfobacillus acetoxydans]
MNEKLANYLNGVFAPYEGVKSIAELRTDLLCDLQERFRELKAEGKDDETAFTITIESIGDIEQTVKEVANLSNPPEQEVLTNFSASNLAESDLAGVVAHKVRFKASALRGSDFASADLTGSSFYASDVREANFDAANLTGCSLAACDLRDASFRQSTLVHTNINASDLGGAKFMGVNLIDVKLTMVDLTKTIFENCSFNGVNFKYADLRGLALDGQTFIGVKFDKAALNDISFKDATLKNVSFLSPYTWSKKYYRAIKTICFDGAQIDKLTYAALKGLKADLATVTVI